jgi:hypothetical protein
MCVYKCMWVCIYYIYNLSLLHGRCLYACPDFMYNPVYFKVYCIDDGSYFCHIIHQLQMYIAYIFIHCLALFIFICQFRIFHLASLYMSVYICTYLHIFPRIVYITSLSCPTPVYACMYIFIFHRI